MAENSAIEWCDHTFNPWVGCTKVSRGCDHCYAEQRMDTRLHVAQWGAGQPRVRTSNANWALPHKWNRQADQFHAQHGRRQRVFCASLADVFDNEVPEAWRADLFWTIAQTPKLDWLLLTKRIGNAAEMMANALATLDPAGMVSLPWPNVWLGCTVVNQAEFDRDLPKLDAAPAAIRFLSLEPLLAPIIDCEGWLWGTGGRNGIDWVIVGGESGPKARPMRSIWVRSLRDQCERAGVPFLFKQWGEFIPADQDDCDPGLEPRRLVWSDGKPWDRFDGQRFGVDLMGRVGKRAAGRLLDGITHDGFPRSAA